VVNHRVTFFEPFELNGHTGYTAWNENTGYMSLCCETCPGQAGGCLCLDRWRPRGVGIGPRPLVWERHADPLNHPQKGERYAWEGMTYHVERVSEKGRWADIVVEGDGSCWSKRQPLPLPAGSVLVVSP
jgi:hypothetical protein